MKGYHHLTRCQRRTIAEQLQREKNFSQIALVIGVHRTTISREQKRNGNARNGYTEKGAHETARGRKMDTGAAQRKVEGILREIVIEKLELGWSPEQISGRLKLEGRGNVSYEAIYRFLMMDRHYGGQLFRLLRKSGRKRKRFRRRSRFLGAPAERRPMSERPIEATYRSELGHWERDLMLGKRSGCGESGSRENAVNGVAVLAMVDRKSRYTLLERVENRTAAHVGWMTAEKFKEESKKGIPLKSITNDRGVEFAASPNLEKIVGVKVFHARAYAAWERGTVENTIGLVRQYLPKGYDLSNITSENLKEIEEVLNARPRKTHGYRSPMEVQFSQLIRLIRGKNYYRQIQNKKSLIGLFEADCFARGINARDALAP
jgi:IS30 family transposase